MRTIYTGSARSWGPEYRTNAAANRVRTSSKTIFIRKSSIRTRWNRSPPAGRASLVLTTLTKEGMPLLRYRTKDLCSLTYEPCACGRTNVRMSRIVGRSDDMLIIRGVNVFPSQVESVVLELPEFEPHYQLVVDRVNNLDTLQVQVEVREAFYSDEISQMMALKNGSPTVCTACWASGPTSV